MFKYISKRVLFSLLALFILMSLIFFLMTSLPILPITRMPRQTRESYNLLLQSLGFFDPIIKRWGDYWGNLFKGNFGLYYSNFALQIPAYFFQNIPNTLYVASIAFFISIFLGFIFGLISGVYRGRWQDTLINVIAVIFVSVPSFIFAILLLRLAGVIGLPQAFENFGSFGFTTRRFVLSSIMPILSLSFGLASALVYYIRNELVEVLNQEYIKTAYSKGLTRMQVLFKHGIRNASIPAFSIIGPSFLTVITGSIIIENIFQLRGLANLLFSALILNEYNFILFETLFLTSLYFIIVIITDVSYTLIDPRIKLAQSSQWIWFHAIKNFIKRLLWKNKWKQSFHSNAYHWIAYDSSMYYNLIEQKCIDHAKKTITLNKQMLETFQIQDDVKFLVVKDVIYKVKKEPIDQSHFNQKGTS